jgi:hypothetical protein
MSMFTYLAITLTSFLSLIVILEIVRRRAIENIRASSYDVYLSYYEKKINDFCERQRDSEDCKKRMSLAILKELASQIKESRIRYIDVEKLYEETRSSSSD